MRKNIVVGVALLLVACRAEKTAPRDRLTIEKVERVAEHTVAVRTPVRAADGNVFVIVHLIEDPAREENREWLRSVLQDWDGRDYEPTHTSVRKSESGHDDIFRRRIKTVHPDRIQLVFEMPQTATMRNLTLPHPISFSSEAPVRIHKPAAVPKVVHQVEPHYPESALRRGIKDW